MRTLIPVRHLIIITHISVFLFTALFVGFYTYSLTKEYVTNKNFPDPITQISQKAKAEDTQEYVVYERREGKKVTGFAISPELEEHIIYSYFGDKPASLLKNGKIFLNGVSGFGFALLDLAGNNLAPDYKILKNKQFPLTNVLFKNEREIFYTYGEGSNSQEKDGRHKLYFEREGNPEVLDASSFPAGEFWLEPVGFSSQSDKLYLQRKSSSLTYAQLWKVNTATKKITLLKSVKGATTTSVKVCPGQDYAVYISAPLDPNTGKYGVQTGPSRLMISNLAIDASKVIFASKGLITDLFVSCSAKKIIAKTQGNFFLFDISGKEYAKNHIFGTPLFFAEDGKTLVVKDGNTYKLVNIQNGATKLIGKETDSADGKKVRYTVLGLSTP